DQDDAVLLDRLNATTAQLARQALNVPDPDGMDEHESSILELESRKEQLEAQLSEHSAAFRAQMQPVTLEAVQSAIPGDAALVEFAIFRPFDPRAERNAEAYGAPHYAAYVIRKAAAPIGRDLGPAAAIDQAIDALRQALRDRTRVDAKQKARALD